MAVGVVCLALTAPGCTPVIGAPAVTLTSGVQGVVLAVAAPGCTPVIGAPAVTLTLSEDC